MPHEISMTEPTITCPKCRNEIKLTESLAAPLVESTRREYERKLGEKDAAIVAKEQELRARAESLAEREQSLGERVAHEVARERSKIAAEEARKQKALVATELDQNARELADLRDVLASRDAKLEAAQKAQAEMMRRERALQDEKSALEVTVEARIQAAREADRETLWQQAEAQVRPQVDEARLKVQERDQTIASMQKTIEDLKRKAEQGSQQLQGEAQEVELEALLAAKFPHDTIEPVQKGESGADALQCVIGANGQPCGAILWESKRTKAWSAGWLAKLKDDQRAAKADVAVLVSHALPKGVESFDLVEGVWVTHPRTAVPLAMTLRQALLDVALVRQAGVGQETKMELVYQYLTGPKFRLRLQAIADAFRAMQDDLAREKAVITKQWAKRETQIDRMMQGTVGMYGDLQAIAGKTLKEIEGLEMGTLTLPFATGGDGDDGAGGPSLAK